MKRIEITTPIRNAYHYQDGIIRVQQAAAVMRDWWQVAPVDTNPNSPRFKDLAGFTTGQFGYFEVSSRALAELPRAPEYDAPAPPLEGVEAKDAEIKRLAGTCDQLRALVVLASRNHGRSEPECFCDCHQIPDDRVGIRGGPMSCCGNACPNEEAAALHLDGGA